MRHEKRRENHIINILLMMINIRHLTFRLGRFRYPLSTVSSLSTIITRNIQQQSTQVKLKSHYQKNKQRDGQIRSFLSIIIGINNSVI